MVQRENILIPAATLIVSLLLAACGGGGGRDAGPVLGSDASGIPATDAMVTTTLPSNAAGTPLGAGTVVSVPSTADEGGTATSQDGRL